MLMKKLITLLIMILIFVTACGENEENQQVSQKKSKTHEKEENKIRKAESKIKDNNQDKGEIEASQLSDSMKAALVFSADEASEYTLSKKEILTGVFEQDYMNKPEKKQLYKLYLISVNGYSNPPKNMKFYSVYPPKKGFSSIMGIGKEKVFIGGTQSPGSYKQLLETGKELDLKRLYNQNKKFKSLNELAQKIEFKDEHPMKNEGTRKDFEAKENANTMAHARSQIYQIITQFEGEPLNTKNYVWDNVKWNDDMSGWTVNYRDKNLEILGTYQKEKDQPIVKLDANGRKIK